MSARRLPKPVMVSMLVPDYMDCLPPKKVSGELLRLEFHGAPVWCALRRTRYGWELVHYATGRTMAPPHHLAAERAKLGLPASRRGHIEAARTWLLGVESYMSADKWRLGLMGQRILNDESALPVS